MIIQANKFVDDILIQFKKKIEDVFPLLLIFADWLEAMEEFIGDPKYSNRNIIKGLRWFAEQKCFPMSYSEFYMVYDDDMVEPHDPSPFANINHHIFELVKAKLGAKEYLTSLNFPHLVDVFEAVGAVL